MSTLSDRDRAILGLEREFFAHAGSKERAMHDRLGMHPTAYYSRLSQIIRNPAALEYAPVTVHRLERLAAQRRARRRGSAA